MLMKMTCSLVFPEGAYFYENPSFLILRGIWRQIHQLSCFVSETSCKECPSQQGCIYYRLSGQNFSGYPGILMKANLFEKTRFQRMEELQLEFFLIGNCGSAKGYLDLYFDHLTRVQKIPVYVRSKKVTSIEAVNKTVSNVFFLTPLDQKEFAESYNSMVEAYNSQYGCDYELLEPENDQSAWSHRVQIGWPTIWLGTKRVLPRGFTGKVAFAHPITLPADLMEVGIGKWNYIGGGQLADDDSVFI